MEWLSLPNVLFPGQIVKTQCSILNYWNTNTVLEVSNDFVSIPLIDEYFIPTILTNDVIKCRFLVGDHEVTLVCIVKEISFKSPPSMKLKVMKIDMWKNQRNSERYDVNYLCKVITNHNEEFAVMVTNLSETGAAIICRDQMSTNSVIKLGFFVFEQVSPFTYGTIMRNRKTVDNKIEYGVKFHNITQEEVERIRVMIEHVKSKEHSAHTKYCKQYGIKNTKNAYSEK